MATVAEDLDARLVALASSTDVDALIDLGCDLSDAGRHEEAADCFRRGAALGDAVAAFDLGNELRVLGRPTEAVTAYEEALAGDVVDAWGNLGLVLEELGDLAGAMRAHDMAGRTGDLEGGLQVAFLLREQGERDRAVAVAEELAAKGHDLSAAVLACWRWDATNDPALEPDLRAAVELYPSARADLAELLRSTGRLDEARDVLEEGARLGEEMAFLPLGNLYLDEMGDIEAAERAYRAGIDAGDAYCHHDLGHLLEHQRGDVDGAIEQYRLGAATGDELAARALRELSDD